MAAMIEPRCSACGAPTRWCEDAWTCTNAATCGSEWDQDHNVKYVAPADQPEWEAVTDPRDRRRVVYWRLMFRGKAVGAVSRLTASGATARNNASAVTWRALGYSQTVASPSGNTDLATHSERSFAERAVLAHWEQNWTHPLRTGPHGKVD